MARALLDGLTPGAVLVMPPSGEVSAEAMASGLSALVAQARRLDYAFVTVTDEDEPRSADTR
jgi:hypothetical protein